MFSVASRSALKRSIATSSRSAAAATRFYSSTMHDNDPEARSPSTDLCQSYSYHKNSPIHNAPGWNEELASASEAAVKADRSEHKPHELAEHTIKHVRERHSEKTVTPAGNEERVDAREASYERDEISGPLKSPKGST
ncbi:hypothetical protein BXZ70DRAFT_1008547 [Cristinia sonorae]|uniref:Uncharacterized protein n=1 Tax=Cristinia sonorae TaxID=1940300 RepID=A0A8K0XPE2_9AGAR|nr:hypothetical protein BXZ70DRAFT_1008547 [Cristinia sonorae]